MTEEHINDVTPDTLIDRFQGKGLKSIILFTVVLHIVVIVGSSVPYLVKKVFGADTTGMTQEERVTAAVQDATAAIRDIAAEYDLSPQDISDQFAGGGARATRMAAEEAQTESAVDADAPQPASEETTEPERPVSQIEKDLEVTEEGPAVPSIEDDIF